MFSSTARSIIALAPTETAAACARKPSITGSVRVAEIGHRAVRVVARGVDRGHQLAREHQPHHLADQVGGVDARDAEARSHCLGERALSDARRAAEHEDQRAARLLELAPGAVARPDARAELLAEPLLGDRAQLVARDLAQPARRQRRLDVARHREALVGLDRRREQRLREHALREGRRLLAVAHPDRAGQERLGRLLERRAELLGHHARELLAPDHLAAPDLVAHCGGGAVGLLEAGPPRHQRVHHDAAHEGPPAGRVLDQRQHRLRRRAHCGEANRAAGAQRIATRSERASAHLAASRLGGRFCVEILLTPREPPVAWAAKSRGTLPLQRYACSRRITGPLATLGTDRGEGSGCEPSRW